MSKLAHSNQETMDKIEAANRDGPDGPRERRTQWFNYGDHPAVRRPTEAHLQPCPGVLNCGIIVIGGQEHLIREGDWIVEDENGLRLERTYKP